MNVIDVQASDATALETFGNTGGDCCDLGAAAILASTREVEVQNVDPVDVADPFAFVRTDANGEHHLSMFVNNMHCAACIRTIEAALNNLPDINHARVNMSTQRLTVTWHGDDLQAHDIALHVTRLGYPVAPFDPDMVRQSSNAQQRRLLASLAVAGFAAGNVMLLSVSVWSGLFSDMGSATRDMFHWISALIALPAIVFAGQPFFRSAISALRAGHTNMDVPISIAVVLAALVSLHQTYMGREHAYFDAAISLVFFLLVGRYLDFRARAKARETAEHLVGLASTAATVINDDGSRHAIPASDVKPGMHVLVATGQRVSVDGDIIEGRSDLDTTLVTGETVPTVGEVGDKVYAGTINLSAPILIKASAGSGDTLLAEIVRLIEHAEQGRARFVRIADRAARTYAPAVHIVAALTFLGWWLGMGTTAETAILHAVAVLIITCPCALGLAVPVVQVIASGVLFTYGILVKSGDAFERLAEADTIVFDKTGTLTTGRPLLNPDNSADPRLLNVAAALAIHSNHPLSRAICDASAISTMNATDVQEVPGRGLEGVVGSETVRLGSRAWCGAEDVELEDGTGLEFWLRIGSGQPERFTFTDAPRTDAADVVQKIHAMGFRTLLISGDRQSVVSATAKTLDISEWQAECLPTDKITVLDGLREQGRKTVMVGDGLNDAPALAAGHASISPASAADVAQTAADFIFQGNALEPVLTCLKIASLTDRLVRQNITIAIGYNVIAVPIAVMGFASPLIAAVAMSSSSLIVTLNALRLKFMGKA